MSDVDGSASRGRGGRSTSTSSCPWRRIWQTSLGVQSSSCELWKSSLPSTLQTVAVHSGIDRCCGPCHWPWRCF
eukprot:6089387-Prorocentrum_lima.AAC.1